MRDRLIFGPILIIALVLGLWLDEWLDRVALPGWLDLGDRTTFPPGMVILPIVFVLAIVAVRELARILHDKGIAASKRIMTTAAALGLAVVAFTPDTLEGGRAVTLVSTAAAGVFAFALVFHSRKQNTKGVIAASGGALLAFVYLGLMFGFIVAIRRDNSAWVVLWVLLTTKSCDIGALFTGKAIGRHKLIPWLSPGKTWEGLFGGVAFAAIIGAVGLWLLARAGVTREVSLALAFVPGLMFGFVGQAGDLSMSLFKRDAGVKDSGTLFPGLGGALDILDSPLLVMPVAFWWIDAVRLSAVSGG